MHRKISKGALGRVLRETNPSQVFSGLAAIERYNGLAIEGGAFLRLEASKGPAKRKPVTLAKVSMQKEGRA